MEPLITIGFIYLSLEGGYSMKKYTKFFLDSLSAQTYKNVEILCLDNGSTDDSISLMKAYPNVRIIRSETNTGFTGHNLLIKEAKGEYYWCTNPDMVFEPDALEKLVQAAQKYPEGGSFGGTILRWDFEKNEKTDFIDTTGIEVHASHYFRERNAGKIYTYTEKNLPDEEEVFGISGANVLFRMNALKSIDQANGEYFDPTFFLYKEDLDVAYRLRWEGWKSYYIKAARMYHDRTTFEKTQLPSVTAQTALNRSHKSQSNKYLSLRNHLFLLHKHFSKDYSSRVKLATFWFEFKKIVFVILFERTIWGAYKEYRKTAPKLIPSKKKVPAGLLEKFMI